MRERCKQTGFSRSSRIGPWLGTVSVAQLVASGAAALQLVSAPTLTLDPNGVTPLAAVVQAETDLPAQARLTIHGPGGSREVAFPWPRTHHYLPVLGLEPSSSYDVEVRFTDAVGNTAEGGPLPPAVTGPLPADFPEITILASQPGAMEPGYTLLDRFRRGRQDARETYTIMLDAQGDVVWYAPLGGGDLRRRAAGTLFYRDGASAVETDLLGREWSRVVLAAPDFLHHDLVPTWYGSFLSLSRRLVSVAGYPTSETDPNAPTQTASIVDEPVVEFGPDGALIGQWSLTDLLDPTRIGYDSLNTSFLGGLDWGHANAVIHDVRDDSFIVSIRHQDAIVKFTRGGQLKWILAPHVNWSSELQPFLLQPVGAPFAWSYHPHAPQITSAGTLLLFDNGNRRASPFDGNPVVPADQSVSRAVEYAIDEQNMQVSQVWEWTGPFEERIYSSFVGDADAMPQTGNVLIGFGGSSFTNGASNASQGLGATSARIIEVDRQSPAQKVFDALVFDPAGSVLFVYRSERIPSLYPDSLPACRDGVDNDGDGALDFDGGASVNGGVAFAAPDAACWRADKGFETLLCGIGPELALLLPWLGRRLRRR